MSTRRVIGAAGLCLAAVVGMAGFVSAQSQVESAIHFYTAGGAYCFRIAPPGMALAEQTEWTIMVLTSTANRKSSFKIRELHAGASNFGSASMKVAESVVPGVWRSEHDREEFFRSFAEGIEGGMLRARVVLLHPAGLEKMSERSRAETYLRFSERGSAVAFDKVGDLKADEFRQYAEYLPD